MFPSYSARALGHTTTAESAVELAAAAGFAGVDLLVADLVAAGTDPARLRNRMDALELRGGAWPLPVRWRDDEATYRADLARLPGLARVAATLGLSRTGTWIWPALPDRIASPAEAIDRAVARLAPVAHILADAGTRLGIEVLGVASARPPGSRPFVHRLDRVGPVLAALRHHEPTVGLLVDAFHLAAAAEPIDAALAWGVESVVWVHLADMPSGPIDLDTHRDDNRALPGTREDSPAPGLLARLSATGYDGPVTVETLAACPGLAGLDPEGCAHAAIRSIDRVWPNPAIVGRSS